MTDGFAIYIPARLRAARLPGKLLRELHGRPLIRHTCAAALACGARRVVLATDDAAIAAAVADLPVTVCMTRTDHESGTDRIAQAAAQLGEHPDAIIVNLQGDEPFMPPAAIRQVAQALETAAGAAIATLCERFALAADIFDPDSVKVVRDAADRALYFSRAPVPWDRALAPVQQVADHRQTYRRHVGIYAYRAGYLKRFVALAPAPLERIERLEQLRALYHGDVIVVPDAVVAAGIGIDTEADLARAEALAPR